MVTEYFTSSLKRNVIALLKISLPGFRNKVPVCFPMDNRDNEGQLGPNLVLKVYLPKKNTHIKGSKDLKDTP